MIRRRAARGGVWRISIFYAPKSEKGTSKWDARWYEGVWLGNTMRSGENLVAINDGVYVVGDVRRKAEDERWSREAVDAIRGSPGRPANGSGIREPPAYKIDKKDPREEIVHKPVSVQVSEAKVHKWAIRPSDVAAHGPTSGCRGCMAVMLGLPREGHSDACRARMEELIQLSEDGQGRLQRYRDRVQKVNEAIVKESGGRVDESDGKPNEPADQAMSKGADGGASGSGFNPEQRAAVPVLDPEAGLTKAGEMEVEGRGVKRMEDTRTEEEQVTKKERREAPNQQWKQVGQGRWTKNAGPDDAEPGAGSVPEGSGGDVDMDGGADAARPAMDPAEVQRHVREAQKYLKSGAPMPIGAVNEESDSEVEFECLPDGTVKGDGAETRRVGPLEARPRQKPKKVAAGKDTGGGGSPQAAGLP